MANGEYMTAKVLIKRNNNKKKILVENKTLIM